MNYKYLFLNSVAISDGAQNFFPKIPFTVRYNKKSVCINLVPTPKLRYKCHYDTLRASYTPYPYYFPKPTTFQTLNTLS